MVRRVEQAFDWMYAEGKLPVMLGGEHSITAGAVRSRSSASRSSPCCKLDAHADMRDTYLDSPDSHACVMRRIRERCPPPRWASARCRKEEAEHLRAHPAPIWSTRKFRQLKGDWKPILDALTDDVFITFDLDGLDPAYLPARARPSRAGSIGSRPAT
jgi:agmatinase